MKSNTIITVLIVGGVGYYLWKSGALSGLGIGANAQPSFAASAPGPVYAPIAQQPGLAIQITSNPNTVVPGTSTAYNQYLPPSQQVNPNDPPPIICQPGQWPTRTTNLQLSPTGWFCGTPSVWI